ncbi:MAG: coenzyme F420-0:L-glutamate ligase [Burkholderiales bacterium]|jgi:coenzyme F420-0:L-glutamate ligase/coenzyme F420-1:gamma-L-glutamate ligase|nr:coenzyme F420-0:L-glutamate ligase [Burkholderiales bacterium]
MQLIALRLPPRLGPGDDLCQLAFEAAATQAGGLAAGDLLVFAQKVVSKTENCFVNVEAVEPSDRARELGALMKRDPRLVQVVLSESDEVVRCTPHVIITRHRSGVVLANAGVDRSNVPQLGPGEWVVTWPRDPDASAARLSAALAARCGFDVPVIINDSLGRAWRRGTVGQAIGASGLVCLNDLRGDTDLYGYRLVSSEVGTADELAAAASAVMGQGSEGTPAVVIRGFAWQANAGASARDLQRPLKEDLFR